MYDEHKAKRVINFIEKITTHTKGELARKPFILEPFQKEVIRDIFSNVNEDVYASRARPSSLVVRMVKRIS